MAKHLKEAANELLEHKQQIEREAKATKNLLEESLRANEMLMKKHSAMEELLLCVVCRNCRIDVSFITCGHTICCEQCYLQLSDKEDQLKRCPSCREPIVASQHIFLA